MTGLPRRSRPWSLIWTVRVLIPDSLRRKAASVKKRSFKEFICDSYIVVDRFASSCHSLVRATPCR